MRRVLKFVVFLLAGLLSAATLAVCILGAVYVYFGPQLPQAGDIGEAQLNEPLRVYTADRKLIGEYGTERRLPRTYDQIPQPLVQAFVAAEDDRFFSHPGVDYQGIIRAAIHLIETGQKTQGGSTITMQLARNLYLSRDRTYTRKIKEIILALRIESKLTKQQILELYLNKIYLGNRAYGVGAAAAVYYHKPMDELSLAQMAMIAGLPKAPSRYNPIANPERARQRRDYVLTRMHELGDIDDAAFKQAEAAPVSASTTADKSEDDSVEAQYVAEMVRQKIVARYGDDAYTQGFDVTTTIDSRDQKAANRALRRALLGYDGRHKWHGPEKTLDDAVVDDPKTLDNALEKMDVAGGLVPAVVTAVAARSVTLATERYGTVQLAADGMSWLGKHDSAKKLVSRGDVVRLAYAGEDDNGKQTWTLAEIPKVQGAMVALDPHDGAIRALAGGFDFSLSKYNRAVQARRQPGSSFKPFLYSAALANGFTTASLINDAPVVYEGDSGDAWRPQNYSGRIYGPTRLREGLVHSRNLVSIRLLRSIGIDTAVDYISRFGLPADRLPRNLSMALGSATFSPLQMAQGYAVFANEGYRVEPYFIAKIVDGRGKLRFKAEPKVACAPADGCNPAAGDADNTDAAQRAPRVITADNAWLVGDMMRDVIRRGTGRRARVLKRPDLSGKTGTTNDQVDAWFAGFNADLVTICWVGFDKLTPMGHRETGAHAALPMWIDFMRSALKDKPEDTPPRPGNLVTVRIDPDTGQLALGGGGIAETFRPDHVPSREEARHSGSRAPSSEVEQLF